MRGYENFNFMSFWKAAAHLRRLGHEVFSPAEFDIDLGYAYVTCDNDLHNDDPITTPHDLDHWYEGHNPVVHDTQAGVITKMLSYDYKVIIDSDAIALLPGWELSTGARGETRVALETGRDIYLYREDLDGALEPANPQFVRNVVYNLDATDVEILSRQDSPQEAAGDDGEVRVVDPVTGGAKGSKDVQYGRLPRSLRQVAKHFTIGSKKYPDVAPGRANWSLGYDWSLGYNALQRHINDWWFGEDLDGETGSNHLTAVAFHALTLLEMQTEGLGSDDRPVHTADRRSA